MFRRISMPIKEYERLIKENHQLKNDLRYVRLNAHALFNIAKDNIEGDEWLEQLDKEILKNQIERELWK